MSHPDVQPTISTLFESGDIHLQRRWPLSNAPNQIVVRATTQAKPAIKITCPAQRNAARICAQAEQGHETAPIILQNPVRDGCRGTLRQIEVSCQWVWQVHTDVRLDFADLNVVQGPHKEQFPTKFEKTLFPCWYVTQPGRKAFILRPKRECRGPKGCNAGSCCRVSQKAAPGGGGLDEITYLKTVLTKYHCAPADIKKGAYILN